MPPIGFWGATTSSYSSAAGTVTFFTPAAARENDTLFAFLVAPSGAPSTPAGWTLLQQVAGPPNVYVYRRTVIADEPATQVFPFTVGQATQPLGVLALWRGLSSAAIISGAIALVVVANVSFVAPAINLTAYSDLEVALYYCADASGGATWTLPGGMTQRAIVHGSLGGGTLVLGDAQPGATGSTGTKTGTASSAQTGAAIQFGIKASPALPAQALVPDIPGALGLPSIGV